MLVSHFYMYKVKSHFGGSRSNPKIARSVGLVYKALGKALTRAVYLEFDSRSGNFEAKSFSFLTGQMTL